MADDMIWRYWEQDDAQAGPLMGGDGGLPAPAPGTDPSQQPQGQPQGQGQPPPQGQQPPSPVDADKDPAAPDSGAMKAFQGGGEFETWKREFFKLAIKSDVQEMSQSIQAMREHKGLTVPQRKFVDDNFHILRFRMNPVIDKACGQVRKLLKQNMDRNHPATSIMSHITATIQDDQMPQLRDVYLKLAAFHGMKADLHRKFLAALTGCVQTGGGGTQEDLAYSEKDYSARVSTRIYPEFGSITLSDWALQTHDAETFLSDSEQERLEDGSPEEKQVLRRRVVIQSIAERLKNRAFLIDVALHNGTLYHIGWDLKEGLLGGYREGKFIVRSKSASDSDAVIDPSGDIVPMVDVVILFMKQTGGTDENGRPRYREVPFIERRDGQLKLVSSLEHMRDVAQGITGFFFKEDAYMGDPRAVRDVMRAIPSLEEMLLREPQ